MNEKCLKLLEQYEIEVTGTRRGRGSYICETNLGKKLLADYTGSEKRLRFVNSVLQELQKRDYAYADLVMENREGHLICTDRDENSCVLKDWHEGRECDTRNPQDIEQAVHCLAGLHRRLCLPALLSQMDETFCAQELGAEMERHNRELHKIYSFIRKRKQKNEFEILFLKYYTMFFEQAKEALEYLKNSGYDRLRERCIAGGQLCHGNYNQHNIWFQGKHQVFAGNFERCRFDVPLTDLYQFLRKIMEKQDWNPDIGHHILKWYDHERPLGCEGWEYMYARLLYPEKFWKLANQYYGQNKACTPWRNAEKLKTLIQQQNARNSFLKSLE
ncbi:MAG: CotS family spore coat protein [Eubacteriales bacterium]|nr:CotS family spore coat protein [Eubacteriales bacterium]